VFSRIQNELNEIRVLGLSSIYSVLATISDPRYKLLIAQKSLIEPWVDCVEGQRPAMPIITLGDRLEYYSWSRRTLRNAIIDLSDRRFLDFLATLRPALCSFC
jgi:hypothetical protein